MITDQRLIFGVRKFDIGTFYGYGLQTVASRTLAKSRRRGVFAIGQVRYDWVSRVGDRSRKSLLGSGDRYVGLDLTVADSTWRVEVNASKPPADLAGSVAARRGVEQPTPTPSADGHPSWAFARAAPLPPAADAPT